MSERSERPHWVDGAREAYEKNPTNETWMSYLNAVDSDILKKAEADLWVAGVRDTLGGLLVVLRNTVRCAMGKGHSDERLE